MKFATIYLKILIIKQMMNHEYNYFIIFNQSFWRWQRNLFCHSRKERQKDTEIN